MSIADFKTSLKNSVEKVFSNGWAPYLLTALMITVLVVLSEEQNKKIQLQEMRAQVSHELSLVRARLEGNILSNIQLVRGLVFTLKTEPDMSKERYSELAEQLFKEKSLIKVVAAAPGLINRYVYPDKQYKKILGMDYSKMPTYLSAALEARDKNTVVIAGPHKLQVGGGEGLLVRYPVFVESGNFRSFWGIVSAVINVEKLYKQSGINGSEMAIDVAIFGKDGKGYSGEQFYGDPAMMDDNPVYADVILPNGSWRIAATPKDGWVIPPIELWKGRLFTLFLGALFSLPILMMGRLASRRRQHVKELSEAKSQIEHIALHDALTNLPNRRFFEDTLAELEFNGNEEFALIVVDLDRFKEVNDTFGHAAGDKLLLHSADVLRSSVSSGDFIARVGGDEFMIISRSQDVKSHAKFLADLIIERMEIPFLYDGHECRIGVSIGIATNDQEDISKEQLLVNADLALYLAKSKGRNRYEFFTEQLHELSVSKKQISDDLLRGIEQGEFIAFYQPQLDARNMNVCGVEALVRWIHPQKGTITPDRFLPIADELGVTSKIDEIIFKQALSDMARWDRLGLDIPKISVNVSQQRLYDEQLINTLGQLAIVPGRLSFELVESIFLDEDDGDVLNNIQTIKDMGISIEIDDFGTGYTSLVSLLKIKPARLKIDRQLIGPSVDAGGPRQMVKSIIEIGKTQNVEIVAEGVETFDHTKLMQELGCDILQGYAFARPMPAVELEAFVSEQFKKAV